MYSGKDLTVIQISDTHLLASTENQFIGINPEQHFSEMLKQIRQQQPHMDLLLHTGDIVQEANPESYQRYMQHMQQLNVPFYHTLGNHDKPEFFPYIGHKTAEEICVVDLGIWQLILLNTAVVGQIDGWIAQHQLDALQQQLQATPNKPTLLGFHHHPFLMQSYWIDQHCLKNADQLLAILKTTPNVKAVVFGHVHQESYRVWHGIQFFSTPATSIQFKPKSQKFALADTPPAYRVIYLRENGECITTLHYLQKYQTVNLTSQGY